MAAHEYVCLTCGNNYRTALSESKCPKCNSANVVKLNSGFLGLFSGGG